MSIINYQTWIFVRPPLIVCGAFVRPAFVGSKSQSLGINFNPLEARLAHMIIPNPM